MLALMLSTCVFCSAPQAPRMSTVSAVAVRGDAELTPAEALQSAEERVEEHLREVWRDRAERPAERLRPFWLPRVFTDMAIRRWLADLSVERLAVRVDREDRERVHEFGNSYQTTLWIAEDPRAIASSERGLKRRLRRLEQRTAAKAGGVALGWVVLALVLGWLDRLSRGYMTGRLRAIGLFGALLLPATLFLV